MSSVDVKTNPVASRRGDYLNPCLVLYTKQGAQAIALASAADSRSDGFLWEWHIE